ncbi:MAG: hypothetical protein FWD13_05745 [Treponema sp.]|nr:hypothetical protein [Treponema sp.]
MRAYKTATLNALGDWRNIETAAGLLNSQTALSGRLDGDAVILESPEDIPPSGGRFTFKIESTDDVTFVPYCEPRPRALRSNPPLIPALSPFPFNQKVSIVFNMPIDTDTLLDNILVEATHRITSLPMGENGDITSFFNVTYTEDDFLVELTAKDDEDILNNLKMLSINIIIGPGIKNITGFSMAGTQIISYMTDASEAQVVYRANNITAVRGLKDGEIYTYTEDPFGDTNTQWNNPSIDRRFNDTNRNIARINFSVTNPPDITLYPNRFTIREMMVFDLNGFPDTNIVEPAKTYVLKEDSEDFDILTMAIRESDYSYTLYYELKSESSGIIHLIVLPWYHSDTPGETIITQEISAASIGGHYVTVVMDKTAPFISMNNLNAVITGGHPVSGVYSFHGTANMTVTLNGISMLSDSGISYLNAWNRPWTMDERNTLQWRILIEDRNAVEPSDWKTHFTGNWQPTSINTYTNSVALKTLVPTAMDLTENYQYYVTAQFIDRMGNTSDTTSAVLGLIVRTTNIAPIPVTNLAMNCTETGQDTSRITQITVNWTLPTGMDGVRITIPGFDPVDIPRPINPDTSLPMPGNINQSYIFTVPSTNISGITSGQPVSNVNRYDITVTAYNNAGGSALTRRIWNVPGMVVNNTTAITEINTAVGFNDISLNPAGQYVLTSNITLENHTTIASFTGRLYGNGHTITIKSFNNETLAVNTGLFGILSGTAVVRDFTLNFNSGVNDNIVKIPSNDIITHFGGITGQAAGTTQIRNIITSGNLDVTLSRDEITGYTNHTPPQPIYTVKYFGGIIGQMVGTVTIINCYIGKNINSTAIGSGNVLFGGIAGDLLSGGTREHVAMSSVIVTGNLRHIQTNQTDNNSVLSGEMNMGGFIGNSSANVTVMDIELSGDLKAIKTGEGVSRIGGIAGHTSNTLYIDCKVSGSIEIPDSFTSNASILLGGLMGRTTSNSEINSSWVRGNINSLYNGNSFFYCGGLFGQVTSNTIVRDSFYEQGSIIISGRTGSLILGGVVGQIIGVFGNFNSSMFNTRSHAIIVSGSGYTGNLYVGGFGGIVGQANLIGCYATSDVHAYGDRNILVCAGGLIGGWSAQGDGREVDYIISRCFATGNVIANANINGNISAGGLVGRINTDNSIGKVSIENSYALGNVLADRTGGSNLTYAGGLVGFLEEGTNFTYTGRHYEINNCFTGGTVTVKSNQSTDVYAGGIVGYMNITNTNNSGSINNNAVLSRSITAMGSGTRNIGRIYGAVTARVPAANRTGNYAMDTTRIEKSNNYDTIFFPYWDGTSTEPVINYHFAPNTSTGFDPHGQNASSSSFFNQGIWTTNGLGFSTSIWDFTNVIRDGYPRLKRE